VAWWSSALTPSREGARSIPNPGNPFPTLGIGCFTPLPGSGWQVLFDSQHGSIGSEKSDTLQKWWRDSQNPIHKKKKRKKKRKGVKSVISGVHFLFCFDNFASTMLTNMFKMRSLIFK
jgi:hypothetical protein